MRTILAATNNAHKLAELRTILAAHDIAVLSSADVGGIPDVDEDGKTFADNAIKKATAIAAVTNQVVFADDSGLEVQALGGQPGVHSARYAGPNATDADRIAKLLHALESHNNRQARFVTVIAIATPAALVGTAYGVVDGHISVAPIGDNGFGYDPIFIPDGHQRSFGEMDPPDKDRISHRANALHNAIAMGLFN